jgi:hypothetical protein
MPPTVMTPWCWTTGAELGLLLACPADRELELEPELECVAFVLPLDEEEPLLAAGWPLTAGSEPEVDLPDVCAVPFTAPVAGCDGVATDGWAVAWP